MLAGRCLAIVLAASLAACGSPVGDLGRSRPPGPLAGLKPNLDRLVTGATGHPASELPRSDEERLRDARLWHFYRLPHADGSLLGTKDDLDRAALLDGSAFDNDVPRYYQAVSGRQYRSSHTRYRALQSDVDMDIAAVPPAFSALCAVEKLDKKRSLAAGQFTELGAKMTDDLTLRVAENQRHAEVFARALEFRYESYTYALKRLLLDAPYQEAREIDASLSQMATSVDAARVGKFCAETDPPRLTPVAAAIEL